jgi:TolB-like protein
MTRMIRTFGPFRIDAEAELLFRGDEPVALGRRAVALLRVLVERPGAPVSKGALIEAAWSGLEVEESNLTVQIAALRRALGEEPGGERWIETLPRRGYRFVGPVGIIQDVVAGAPELALPDRPTIAVLPFANLSGDAEQEHFADGITEDIISALSRFRSLFVIARSSTFTYKGQAVAVKQVARELGVQYVLEGSVRKAGPRVRINVQLIDAEIGIHVWAQQYDRLLEHIFVLNDEITGTIVATMEPEIGAAEREKARRKPPGHLGSWEHYQRGMWHLLRRNREDYVAARALLRKAIELDATFAAPHAALALYCFFQITHGFTSELDATLDELLAEARQAVTLDPKDGLGHTALGLAFMERRENFNALAEHQIALNLNPNSSLGHYAFGYALLRAERFHEALEQFDAAMQLSPRDPVFWSFLTLKASTLYQLGRYRETVKHARDAARHSISDLIGPYTHLAAALGQLGLKNEARAAVDELLRIRPGLTVAGVRSWPHNRSRSPHALEHALEGLRRAGLPEH